MSFLSWPEIKSFHNILKYTKECPQILNNNQIVQYKAKIKLHGTMAGVRIYKDGKIIPQNRTKDLSIANDHHGFAKFVLDNKKDWIRIYDDTDEEIVIFGEWVGKGIQGNTAVSNIPKKSFAVFAARFNSESYNKLIIQPNVLNDLVKHIPDVYVLPWFSTLDIDFSSTKQELTKKVEQINLWVEEIEKNDLWVENTFGINGTGEGLVFYPTSKEHLLPEDFANLVFKAKGEKHKVIRDQKPAQIDPSIAKNINDFVDLVLTQSRLEQAAITVSGFVGKLKYDIKLISYFLIWIENDIKKETNDELKASGLEYNQVKKELLNKARSWYLEKSKEI